MAEITVDGSRRLDDEGRAKMLRQRFRQIYQVSRMLRSRRCFRRSVIEYFGDATASNRKPVSERLLDWVFGSRPVKANHAACCDYCDAKMIAKRGRLAYAAWIIGSGSMARVLA
jgi:ATP-dependent DNA helicase RecQ